MILHLTFLNSTFSPCLFYYSLFFFILNALILALSFSTGMKYGLLSYYEMLVVDSVSLTGRQYSRFLLLIAILVGIDLPRGLKYMEAEYSCHPSCLDHFT